MKPTTALIVLLVFSIINAIIKAWRDLNIIKSSAAYDEYDARWHKAGFIYQVFIYSGFSILLSVLTGELWSWPFIMIIGCISYWAVFDCTIGKLLAGSYWHIGTTGFDAKMELIFGSGKAYLLFKLIWLLLASGAYLDLFAHLSFYDILIAIF